MRGVFFHLRISSPVHQVWLANPVKLIQNLPSALRLGFLIMKILTISKMKRKKKKTVTLNVRRLQFLHFLANQLSLKLPCMLSLQLLMSFNNPRRKKGQRTNRSSNKKKKGFFQLRKNEHHTCNSKGNMFCSCIAFWSFKAASVNKLAPLPLEQHSFPRVSAVEHAWKWWVNKG